jgi:hypothetical protein
LIGPIGYDVRELHFLPYYARDLSACELAAVPVPLRHYPSRPGARVIYYFYWQDRPRAGDGIWSAAGQVRHVGDNILL